MSGSVFDMLTDPTTSALMGLAQGFGQAAMPTRMPTPLGAVLGQGIGGMQQGLATGQALRRGDIQNQQARIGLDWYKNMTNPQQSPGGTAQSAAFGAPTVDANGQYMVSPQMMASMIPMMVAQGKDPSGIMKLIESYGTTGRAIDRSGNIFSIPGGTGAISAEAAAKGFGTKTGEFSAPAVPTTFDVPDGQGGFRKQLMTPQAAYAAATGASATDQNLPRGIRNNNPLNLEFREGQPGVAGTDGRFGVYPTMDHGVASAVNQLQRYGQSGLNTISDITAKWAPAGENSPAKYAQQVAMLMGTKTNAPLNMGDPQTMTRLVAAMGQVENGQMVDPGAVTRGVGMALSGGRPAAPTQVAGPGAPAGAAMSPQAPQTAPAAPMGGIAGPPVLTPQQEADLKVSTANRMPSDLRVGGERVTFDANGQPTGVIKNPEHITIQNADGTSTVGHLEPAPPGSAPGTQGTFVPVARLDRQGHVISDDIGKGVPPDVQQGRTELVKEFFGKDTDSYVAAKNTHAWLNQIDQAADAMNAAGGIYNTGPFAAERIGLMQRINDIGRTTGLGTPFDQKALSAPEELRKATTTAGFELSSHYEGHARQAASTIENATSAVPGMANSPQGIKLVSAGIREGAQSAIDSHEYRQARFQGQDPYALNPAASNQRAGAGLETAETDFYKKFTPEMYSTRAISTVHPVAISAKSLDDFNTKAQKYLPGTQIMLNGQPKVIPPRPDAPPIPSYIQNRFMTSASNGG